MSFRPFYFLKESLISFRKNWVISAAAITTVALSLLVVGFFMLIAFTVNDWMKMTESKVEVVVFLIKGLPAESIEAMQAEIMSWDDVKEVTYVTEEQALERLKKEFKETDMLEMIEENPLPASFEISLKNPQKANQIVNALKGRSEIDDIRHDRKTVEKLLALTKTARWVGVVFATLLMFASLVLISNAIRLAIYARRKEVAIMRLVGASNWFIRWPFLFEGIIQGFIGALVAVITLYVIQVTVIDRVNQVLVFLPVGSSQQEFYRLVFGMIIVGAMIGAAGSTLALRRFLKV